MMIVVCSGITLEVEVFVVVDVVLADFVTTLHQDGAGPKSITICSGRQII